MEDEFKEFHDKVRKNIVYFREKNLLTPMDVYRKSGVPKRTVNLIEKGGANATLNILLKLCKALNVDLIKLISFNGPYQKIGGTKK